MSHNSTLSLSPKLEETQEQFDRAQLVRFNDESLVNEA